jgi:hypothetical protein
MNETLKWIATAVLVTGAAVNGMGLWPWGPLIHILGGALWLRASIVMKDRALIVTNAIMMVAGAVPLLWRWFSLH